jgi:hypothetical protein
MRVFIGDLRDMPPVADEPPAACLRPDGGRPQFQWGSRCATQRAESYFGVIFVILLPCMPRPAISPFWPKTKA